MKKVQPTGIISVAGPACKADGGGVVTDVAGGNPNVIAAAKKRKFGGKVLGGIAGNSAKPRLDRAPPGRKRGGRVGADLGPLSSAGKVG
jgi:hypothetical protein